MKKWILTIIVATASVAFTTAIARGQSARDELETRAQHVNSLADRHGGMREVIHSVSVETGVPQEQLQRMHDEHPDAGPAGLMIASVLADNTKKSPEMFLRRHVNGRGWASIARENNVPLDKINNRLDKLEHDLDSLQPTGRERGREYQDEGGSRYRNRGY
ncbi:MAG TPA: hypothetical protein VN873_17240 [Candidatus Angelobacter sp.]|nr:hypothetical protein [Candidatus Angelobacter sp.]